MTVFLTSRRSTSGGKLSRCGRSGAYRFKETNQSEPTISRRRFVIGWKECQTPEKEARPNWLLRCCDFQWDRLQSCHGGVWGACPRFRGALGILTVLFRHAADRRRR
ncbi:hypothetical protein OJAV_G00163670 [Oryzias javanicus]|uniref:Uncharacterized protein n=1 Tax=Oryzias javanicus TaxID=123683 RepID=A0A3S2PWT2_ORYJA|nr:hypothetical protein OJAV_G00163670 [Oryzias javanicus]